MRGRRNLEIVEFVGDCHKKMEVEYTSESQEYFDWKGDVDDALCMLYERIFILEAKVKQLEKNAARRKTIKS